MAHFFIEGQQVLEHADQAVKNIAPRSIQHLLFWTLVVLGIGLDLWTKHWAFQAIDPVAGMDLISGLLKFDLAYNTGAAFSFASGKTLFLRSISSVAFVAVIGFFLIRKDFTKFMCVVLGLMTAGIAGNAYDRLFHDGMVRDFVHVYVGEYHWPIFNVADALLCISVGLLILSTFITDMKSRRAQNVSHQEGD